MTNQYPDKPANNQEALKTLVDAEGYSDTMTLLGDLMADVDILCNAVCMNCGAHDKMEPDQDRGYCSECGKNTVKHAFVLAGII